jgi:hypothetical protein
MQRYTPNPMIDHNHNIWNWKIDLDLEIVYLENGK